MTSDSTSDWSRSNSLSYSDCLGYCTAAIGGLEPAAAAAVLMTGTLIDAERSECSDDGSDGSARSAVPSGWPAGFGW